jgi:hypothetical protein
VSYGTLEKMSEVDKDHSSVTITKKTPVEKSDFSFSKPYYSNLKFNKDELLAEVH